jgi:hypothetical protein
LASNPDREILLAQKGINLVIPRVSDIFRLSISFHSLEGVSAFKGAGKCLSPTKKLAV